MGRLQKRNGLVDRMNQMERSESMEQHERTMIEGLFARLGQAQAQGAARDTEAETLLRDSLAKQPAAPYYMAQAILVQEHLLESLQAKVEQLERDLAERPAGGGSFLSGLFGGGAKHTPAEQQPSVAGTQAVSPFQQSSGGFLGSALQTAAAVAGGLLIGNAISGLFAEEVEASEAEVDEKTKGESVEDEELESMEDMDEDF
jgi:hypothetical protein